MPNNNYNGSYCSAINNYFNAYGGQLYNNSNTNNNNNNISLQNSTSNNYNSIPGTSNEMKLFLQVIQFYYFAF